MAVALGFLWNLFSRPKTGSAGKQARRVLTPPAVTNFRRAFFPAALCIVALLAGTRLRAGEDGEIQPPFNLQWGEAALRLEEALLGTSAKIVERSRAAGGREIWKVDGLPGIALQRVSFHLRDAGLAEVELQYWKDDWSPATYEEFMQSVRRQIEARHGLGKPIARQQDAARGVTKTLLGHRWESGGSALELYYFAAQDPKNVFRTLSLHYKRGAAIPPTPGRGETSNGRAAD